MNHPRSVDLEAFACGEPWPDVEAHLHVCAACEAFVARLRGEVARGPKLSPLSSPRPAGSPSPVLRVLTWALPPLAVAAGVLFFLRGTVDHSRGGSEPAAGETPVASAEVPSGTRFKGRPQVAAVRERGGQQERFATDLHVMPGDRFRVEVALDRPETILAAVRGDDGQWLEIMPPGHRGVGTHYSEQAARVDTQPMSGWIIVGTPEAVAQARASGHLDGVATLRVSWDGVSPLDAAGGAGR